MSDLDFTPQEPEPDTDTQPGAPSIPQLSAEWVGGHETQPPSAPHEADSETQAELFQSFSQPEIVIPKRIPHMGHLALLLAFLLFGFLCMTLSVLIAVFLQFHSLSNLDRIKTEVGYILGSEAILYLVTLVLSFIVFPLFWNKGFFAGIQWRGATALRQYRMLITIALACVILAVIDDKLLPGPKNAPIEDMFRSPGAAWLMFAFGITFAPFFEEIAFRGFMLPAFATAWDWVIEKTKNQAAPPLDVNGHPQWSLSAMVAASLVTSLPFALMHAQQTGWALGPFVLLMTVSLILCAVRLKTRSLASSTLVHATYNFILFSTALISSGGFRHLDKI